MALTTDPVTRRAYMRQWNSRHKDRIAAKNKRWSEKNAEKKSAYNKAYREAHREKLQAYQKNYVRENRAKVNALMRAWMKNNRHKVNERCNRHRAHKVHATPKWANRFFLQEAYHLAVLRTRATGIKWHVDHIVPLNSKIVCGLHVEYNIRVIPALDNLKKGNAQWPHMPS